MILDIRTLMIVMIATSLLLAVSLMVAVGPRFHDGLGKWTAALLIQAAVFGLFSARGEWPDLMTIVVPNALFMLCLALQAAAIFEFHGKTLSRGWYVLPTLLVGAPFALAIDKFSVRVVLAGVTYGTGMLALAILALAILVQRQNRQSPGSARWLLLTG